MRIFLISVLFLTGCGVPGSRVPPNVSIPVPQETGVIRYCTANPDMVLCHKPK